MTEHLNKDALFRRDSVLLIVDDIQPPPGLSARTAPRPMELGLFIAVCDDGAVHAFNGHVDLGTGIRTALAQIVAEELDLSPGQVNMVLGDTAVTPDQGATIASASIQISAIPLRNAAAEARRFLVEKAAGIFGVPAHDLVVTDGVVSTGRADDNRRLSYAELVRGDTVRLRVSGEAPLKPVDQYRVVGTGTPRIDIPAKATGTRTFVHDMRVPGMLHGRVIRPPYAGIDSGDFVGTSLLGVDRESIAHIPGIIDVVAIGDFVGVVAEREEQAIKAAKDLRLTWKPWSSKLPDLSSDLAGALRANPSKPRVVLDKGDVDAALAAADQRLRRTYVWPYQLHGSIGPSCAVADVGADGVKVWSGTQNPHLLRADIAWLLECPEDGVEIIRMEAAGCYGRNCADDVSADAVLLSRAVGRPVRVQLTREQEHVWEPKGAAQLMEVEGGLTAEGAVAGYDFATSYPSNGAPTLALLLTGRVEPVAAAYEMGDRTSIPPYDFDDMRVTINDMAPIVRASWMRGVSALPNTFAHESHIDELAFAAGVDPVEFRLRHLPDERAADLVKATAARAGWEPRTARRTIPPEGDILRGRGFAYARYIHSRFPGFGAAWAAWAADVAVDRKTGEVAVTRVVIGHDAGMMVNPDGVRHQIHGNVIQSASRVLKEQVSFEGSAVTSKEWGGYPIMTFPEVPDIDVLMMPRQHEPPLGSGESAAVPSAAAIANAIFDATGIRFRELPITAERVREALNPRALSDQSPAPLAKPRRRKWLVAGLAGLFGTVVGMGVTALPWRAPIAPIAPPGANTWSAETLERGRQLAALGDCAVCHTAADGIPNAGGLAMETPFGTVFSTNITPDVETGIGAWSFAAFDRAMRDGISRDGRHLYPAFPYTAFRGITEADMQALYAHLMSQPPVSHRPPETRLSFPFGLRPLMAAWNTLFLRNGTAEPIPERGAEWNRGAYLVNGLGHCAACHSPRNALGAEKTGAAFLAGGMVDGWEAPALNGLSKAPTPWTVDDLETYLTTGFSESHGVAAGPMGPVVAGLATLPKSDIRAIATYLTDLDGTATSGVAAAPVSISGGERIFQGACRACHSDGAGPTLFGVSPSMAANTNVHSDKPDNLARVILHGIQNPATPDLGYMPAFKDSFTDRQVADLLAYLRTGFAPDKPAWSGLENTVARIRANPGSH
ncbi:aldehyde dehydrogenase [Skermanella stibiiresistens SB22]|uniref:Aldehyde dehydrogenase n=1 Tax=Skermanella stibiiresistens SB22 TaxID=1385369 RepID=W9GZU7_9PROT|nr:molybdopterin cofactor-binding domain-containing protein [Skermanella stibiiresistens]EWY39455.1 aldehyde dehydrogenase [Skermanella stibiiresistens SB22]